MIHVSLRILGPRRHVLAAKCAVLLGAVVLNAVVLAALVLTARPVHAQTVAPTATQIAALPAPAGLPPAAGLFFKSDKTDTLFAAATLASDVTIQVTGEVARVNVVQHFRNPSKVWLEGVYVFPLPERSAVDRLTLRIGEREVRGRILEKAEAEYGVPSELLRRGAMARAKWDGTPAPQFAGEAAPAPVPAAVAVGGRHIEFNHVNQGG